MGFRGQAFAFDSPGAAVTGLIDRLGPAEPGGELTPLSAARGRILGESVGADRDSPAFDYSSMDGFAVCAATVARRASEGGQGDWLRVPIVGEARIGRDPTAVGVEDGAWGAVRVATGSAMPPGTDAVIRREEVQEHAGEAGGVLIASAAAAGVRAGDFVRRRGENARAGERVLEAGSVITPAAMGTLAAVGHVRPRVFEAVRVAVITTGDELVAPELKPGAFETRNSNGPAMAALLEARAWIRVVSVGHAGDEPGRVDAALREAAAGADAVVMSGGVSMGQRDPVRDAVDGLGAAVVFHGLPQRPGKPMLAAVLSGGGHRARVIFGLPGNPISAMVTCTRIVLPVLSRCAGAKGESEAGLGPYWVALGNPDGKTLDLWWHRLVRLAPDGAAVLLDARGSGDIIAGGRSDGFVEVPPGPGATQGPLRFYPWPT